MKDKIKYLLFILHPYYLSASGTAAEINAFDLHALVQNGVGGVQTKPKPQALKPRLFAAAVSKADRLKAQV